MSNFGSYHETPDFKQTLTVGKFSYKVIAVNPSIAQLEKMKVMYPSIYVPKEENVYVGKTSSTFGGAEDTPYADIRFYLQNVQHPELITQASYRVLAVQDYSERTKKYNVINLYGVSAYLEEDKVLKGDYSGAFESFIPDQVKIACKGEVNLIAFLRALMNMPLVQNEYVTKSGKTVKSVDLDKRPLYTSQFSNEDLKAFFDGKFQAIQNIIASLDDRAEVVLYSGVRTTDDGKRYQQYYVEKPMKKYQLDNEGVDENNIPYIVKDITSTVDAGKYGSTYWGLQNITGRIFDDSELAKPASTAGFGQPAQGGFGQSTPPAGFPSASGVPSGFPGSAPSGFPSAPTQGAFPPAPDFGNQEDPNDLPF